MSDLPVNIDTTYDDDGADASVKAHQQHHDALHAAYNDLAGASPDLAALGIAEDDHNHTGTYDPAGTAATAVAAHSADTTSVHGIADTTVLATDAEVTSAVSTHAGATDPHGDRAYADGLASDYATAAQGGLADSAVQPGDTIPVADGGTGATTAADARTNLDVDQAGTDNSTDVTLAGTPDYLTIAGQVITRGLVDLAADVTGDLPVAEGGTGSSTASGARTNLGLVIGTDVASQTDTRFPAGADIVNADIGASAAIALSKLATDPLARANHTGSQAQSTVTNLVSDLAAKAPLASPALTGTPTVPTAAADTSTTQAASTAFVVNQIQTDTDEVGDGDMIGFEDVGGVQTPYPILGAGIVTIAHNFTGAGVANTTTETALSSDSWTIPANEAVSGTTVYRLELSGGYGNNSGSNRDVTFRLKQASGIVFSVTFSTIPTSATGRSWMFTAFVKPITFGSVIWSGVCSLTLSAAGSGAVFQTQQTGVPSTPVTIDTSVSNDLQLTVQHSAAASTITSSMTVGIVSRLA